MDVNLKLQTLIDAECALLTVVREQVWRSSLNRDDRHTCLSSYSDAAEPIDRIDVLGALLGVTDAESLFR